MSIDRFSNMVDRGLTICIWWKINKYGGFHSHGGSPDSWMVYTGKSLEMDDDWG